MTGVDTDLGATPVASGDGRNPDLLVWRSLLYVPANNTKFVEKAHTRGADAIILDLEDSVPVAERAAARQRLAESVGLVSQGGADVVVRINRGLRDMVRDVEAAVAAGARALMVTKADGAAHLRLIAELVDEVERESGRARGTVRLIPMIETADAFFRVHPVARGSSRNVALVLGGEDFAMDAGFVPDGETLAMPKQTVLLAARAAGLIPLGFMGTVADLGDPEGFRETVRRSRRFGFEGASCVHPSMVPVLNEEMTPSAEEAAHAERVVEAYDAAQQDGKGAILVDGKMIDVPVALRAQRLLARLKAIRDREHAANT